MLPVPVDQRIECLPTVAEVGGIGAQVVEELSLLLAQQQVGGPIVIGGER